MQTRQTECKPCKQPNRAAIDREACESQDHLRAKFPVPFLDSHRLVFKHFDCNGRARDNNCRHDGPKRHDDSGT